MEEHSTLQEIIENRIKKMLRFRDRGDEPYKYIFHRSSTIAEARTQFEELEKSNPENAQLGLSAQLAGRIVARREQGKSTFMDIRDESAKIQLFFGENQVGADKYETLKDYDLGDFVGASGKVRRTKRGEITLFVETFQILTKSLRSLPEKYHGLTDIETRYRQRYLDLVANPEVMDIFRKRTQMIEEIRNYLKSRGFLEVETPMLHPIPGGATARPFITHHNAYDTDLYLRIAPELYLKKLIVGGFEKVFELNRCFRNEGVDTKHNPEFTIMEMYEAYQDYIGLMDETEDMLYTVMTKVIGSEEFEYQGLKISLKRPWERIPLYEAIRNYAKIDLENTRDREEAKKIAESIGVEIKPEMGYGKIVDEVMSTKVKPHLINPTFLYDYPVEISPLAKRKRDNPALTERYQLFIGGLEVCNAFSELNDPLDQRERFLEQVKLREAGDEEAQYLDEDFLTALEVGMPPTAGLGIGIDRLAMLCTNSGSIRDVILFPLLRKI
ncbi:MAG: lysine--tRNA ligase [Candidatus Hydrogenedentes bacterium]|nr:lysine--tRNA ligase [Candidatus Hydrogenedentota bacterium]